MQEPNLGRLGEWCKRYLCAMHSPLVHSWPLSRLPNLSSLLLYVIWNRFLASFGWELNPQPTQKWSQVLPLDLPEFNRAMDILLTNTITASRLLIRHYSSRVLHLQKLFRVNNCSWRPLTRIRADRSAAAATKFIRNVVFRSVAILSNLISFEPESVQSQTEVAFLQSTVPASAKDLRNFFRLMQKP